MEANDLDDEIVVVRIEVEGRVMEWTEKGATECWNRIFDILDKIVEKQQHEINR